MGALAGGGNSKGQALEGCLRERGESVSCRHQSAGSGLAVHASPRRVSLITTCVLPLVWWMSHKSFRQAHPDERGTGGLDCRRSLLW